MARIKHHIKYRIKYLWIVCFFAAVSTCCPGQQVGSSPDRAQTNTGEHLRFVLIVTRHGVRSATWTNQRLDTYSAEPWPQWPVAPGLLTPHGHLLMRLFGAYDRRMFASEGLLTGYGCADAAHIFVYTDTDERTVETGSALAEGLAPGCALPVHTQREGAEANLFHNDGPFSPDESQQVVQEVAARIHGDPASLLAAFRPQLTRMQQILLGCSGAPCSAQSAAGKVDLLTIAPSLAAGNNDHPVQLKGPLQTGATMAENFQLEYLEGMPAAQVGWGRVDASTLLSLMKIHAASSDLVQRTPAIARIQASTLAQTILRTLEQAERQNPTPGALGAPADRLAILVGHDTNLANLATLLDVHWHIEGYQPDDAAPGGGLVFELWQRPGREEEVRLFYMVQTPSQMRSAIPLTLAEPPAQARLSLSGCAGSENRSACDWPDFEKLLVRAAKPFANPRD